MRPKHVVSVAATIVLLTSSGGAARAYEPTGQAVPVAIEARAEAEAATDQEAIRFRQSFGLRADTDFVRAARLDTTTFSSDPYGVPLTQEEIADLLNRAQVQASVWPAVETARKSDYFAGAYLDQLAGGMPVFMFTADDALATDRVAAALPSGTGFRIEAANRTERELLDLKARIDADIAMLGKSGIDVVQVAFKASRNTLLVGVHGLTAASAKTLVERYGPGLDVFEDDYAQSDVCDATDNCRPIKGGISINEDGSTQYCTSGFVVHKYTSNTWLVLTAGHCIQVHGGYDAVWEHNNNSFGRSLRETWMPGGSGPADVGLITIFSDDVALMTQKNLIRRTNGQVRSVTSVTFGDIEGYQACRVGRTSGHDCGVVKAVPVSRQSIVSGYPAMTVTQVATVSFDSTGGDSGGPVFFYIGGGTSGPQVSPLGTHVHSEPDSPTADEGWYSPIYTGSDDYELESGGFPYRPCLTAACLN